MGFTTRIKNLHTFTALGLVLMPLVLRLIAGEWRESISDYEYSNAENFLGTFLNIAATLFCYDSVVNKKWYQAILGLSLFVVSWTPHLDFPILHYTAAIMFFFGSLYVMVAFSSAKQRKIKLITAIVMLIFMITSYFLEYITILQIEWIGLFPILIHFIGETHEIID